MGKSGGDALDGQANNVIVKNDQAYIDQSDTKIVEDVPKDIKSSNELSNTGKILSSLAAGGIAGGIAKTVIAPLDRSKIFFQTNETKNYRFRYALRWLKHGYRTEGLLSLWRGNTATLARIVPYSAINFMSFEQYKKLLKVEDAGTPGYHRFIAGSMAGSTGQLLTYPLDRASAVVAVTPSNQNRNLAVVFCNIYKEEGFLALYRGLTPTLLGVIPYAGTSFYTYETLKGYAVRRKGGDATHPMLPSPLERLAAGAVAGLLGQTASYPLDIVRRRMQTGRQLGKGNKYITVLGTLKTVYRCEGLSRGLYKGLSMNFVKGPIASGITFATFDYAASVLRGIATGLHPLYHLDQVDRQLVKTNINMNLVMEYHRTFSEMSHAAWGTSPGSDTQPGYWAGSSLVQAQKK